MIVTLQDARSLQYCSRGIRDFCSTADISWEDFITNGIESEKLLELNDAMASALVTAAEKRHAG